MRRTRINDKNYLPSLYEVLVFATVRKISGGRDVDVVTVISTLEQRTGITSMHGTVIACLRRLEKRGLLSSIRRPGYNHESRVFFSITPEGEAELDDWLLTIMEVT